MSRNCCSQCGEVGHNKRNQRKCRVNVERNATRASVPAPVTAPVTASVVAPVHSLIDVRTNLVQRHLEKARTEMNDFALLLTDQEGYSLPPGQYILNCFKKVSTICEELTSALQNDTQNIVDPTRMLSRLNAGVGILNHIVQAFSETNVICLVIKFENRTVKVSCEDFPPSRSKFLKKLAVIHDISVTTRDAECECPICFESVPKTEAIYTSCCHGFCVTCIKGLATSVSKAIKETKPVCPMCRREITDLKTESLELCNEVKTHLSAL